MTKLEKLLEAYRNNTHQTHFEDLVFLGSEGLGELNNKIESLLSNLETGADTGANYTTKIDGSPAVICWSKFPGYPDNSVCLKSFVSSANNCLSSDEDIEEKYGDRPDMAAKLQYCLQLASYIPANQAWQGDCLFSQSDKKVEEIQGTEYITFHPNKIVYAFSEDNPDYDKVANADFGIAFHTIYTDAGNGKKKQSFRIDPTKINAPDNFFIMSPALDYKPESFDTNDIEEKFNELKSIEDELIDNQAYEDLVNNETFMSYWNTFENKNIADKRQVTLNVDTFYDDLVDYINERRTSEWTKKNASLKTAKGRMKALDNWADDIDSLHTLLASNQGLLDIIVDAFNLAAEIKMDMWDGFKQSKAGYSTFYKSKTKGIIDADMEGIAMSDSDGNIVKIVDRSTFSANNRDSDILAGWEHPERESLRKVRRAIRESDGEKIAVVAFGRLNPPTIGHQKMIDVLAKTALEVGGDAKLYLSHSVDKKNEFKNPLDYETKYRYVDLAFGDKVEVVRSSASTIIFALAELYQQGYTDIIYVGGSDRIGGEDDMTAIISKYNGYDTPRKNMYYSFNSIDFVNAGERDENSDDLASKASASLARSYVRTGDFESFKQIVPFNESNAKALFNELSAKLPLTESSLLRFMYGRLFETTNKQIQDEFYAKDPVNFTKVQEIFDRLKKANVEKAFTLGGLGKAYYGIQRSGDFSKSNVISKSESDDVVSTNTCGGNLVLVDFSSTVDGYAETTYRPVYCDNDQIFSYITDLAEAINGLTKQAAEKDLTEQTKNTVKYHHGYAETSISSTSNGNWYCVKVSNAVAIIKDNELTVTKASPADTVTLKLRASLSSKGATCIIDRSLQKDSFEYVECAGVNGAVATEIQEAATAYAFNNYKNGGYKAEQLAANIKESGLRAAANRSQKEIEGVLTGWTSSIARTVTALTTVLPNVLRKYAIPYSEEIDDYIAYRDNCSIGVAELGEAASSIQQFFESSFYNVGSKDLVNPSDIYLVDKNHTNFISRFMSYYSNYSSNVSKEVLPPEAVDDQEGVAIAYISAKANALSKNKKSLAIAIANALTYSGLAFGISLKKVSEEIARLNYTGIQNLKIDFKQNKESVFCYVGADQKNNTVQGFDIFYTTNSRGIETDNGKIYVSLNSASIGETKTSVDIRLDGSGSETQSVAVGSIGAAQGGRYSGKNLVDILSYIPEYAQIIADNNIQFSFNTKNKPRDKSGHYVGDLLHQVNSFLTEVGKLGKTDEESKLLQCRALTYILAAGLKYKVIDNLVPSTDSNETPFNTSFVDYFKVH